MNAFVACSKRLVERTESAASTAVLLINILDFRNEPNWHAQPLYNHTSQRTASRKAPSAFEGRVLERVKINEQTGSSVAILNQFVTGVRSASILLDVADLRARNDGTSSHIQRR